MTRVIRTVEMMSYHLMTVSTFFLLTVEMWVAKNVVMKEIRIPTAVTIRGKYKAPLIDALPFEFASVIIEKIKS